MRYKHFFEFIGKEHIDLLKKSAEDPDPSVLPHLKDCIEIINSRKKTSFSVVVEESNCIGLLGPVRESKKEKSHFDALMRKVENNEAKKETTNTGGTWGKGSSIFTYTSHLWTWFSYSYLSTPWHDKRINIEHKRRLIGRCMLAPFFQEKTNESYLGDGWFCDTEKFYDNKLEDGYPFVNTQADELAEKLGLSRRTEPGTTFFIPFFNAKLENGDREVTIDNLQKEFVEQILQNWYIPIFNELLTVQIVCENSDTLINKSYLGTIPELKFKLQLLDWYEKNCPPEDKRFIKEQIEIDVPALKDDFVNERTLFAKERQTAKIDLIIRVLDEDEDFDDNWETVNKIALCRNKGMLVDNEALFENKTLRTESILFGGVMSKYEVNADKKKHLDLFLAYSENPAHTTWCRAANDYDRCFLDKFERTRFKPEASIRHLFNEIYRVFKKLLEEDIEHKENKDICTIFKKLAKLRSKGSDSTGKPLFYMRSLSDEVDTKGRFVYTKKIISASDENEIEVFFKSYIDSLEGEWDKNFDNLGIGDFSNIEILNENDGVIDDGTNPRLKLTPTEEVIIKIRTCSIDGNPFFKNVEPFIKAYAKELDQ